LSGLIGELLEDVGSGGRDWGAPREGERVDVVDRAETTGRFERKNLSYNSIRL
jgi:hypothetical protein